MAGGCFAALSLGWEAVRLRRGQAKISDLLKAYGVPVLLSGLLVLLVFARSNHQRELGQVLHAKHTQNVCQIYAFSYQQRHAEWDKSPWTECGQLMTSNVRENPSRLLARLGTRIGASDAGALFLECIVNPKWPGGIVI